MKKVLLVIIVLAILAGGGSYGYMYLRDAAAYFTTDNAAVTADTVTVTPLVSGTVSSWNVKEGDTVKAGQVLGKLDLSGLVSSSAISASGLSSSADPLVSKSDIKSPIDGKVIVSKGLVGLTLAPGSQAAVIANTNDMYINANIEETSIFRIMAGQSVIVRIDAYPGKVFAGYVDRIGQSTQSAFSQFPNLNTSGTYTKVTQLIPVRIVISNPDNLPLIMGMNATVRIKY